MLLNLEAPVNDYTLPCWRNLDGKPATDVMYIGAGWMMKLFVAYDFVRAALPEADRLRIEQAIMKQSHAFATHLDVGLRTNLPQRLVGNYVSLAGDAVRSGGEFVRNGNYCIPKQGLIYHHGNLQGALFAARSLARRADRDLYTFRTRGGMNGTEAPRGVPAKSLATGVKMHLDLVQKILPWYMHEPQFATQTPRDATHLGRMESRYMNSPNENDNFHELGLLLTAPEFPALPVAQVMLRDGMPVPLRFPGSTGNAVFTGTGNWTDFLAAMPAVYLLRP